MWNPFKRKNKKLKPSNKSGEDLNKDFENAQKLVNKVFYPQLKKNLDIFNEFLKDECGIQAGIEVNWFFEKVD